MCIICRLLVDLLYILYLCKIYSLLRRIIGKRIKFVILYDFSTTFICFYGIYKYRSRFK